jgi:hypothetical protein
MSTRFPPANLPPEMGAYRSTLENMLSLSENAQDNAESIVNSLRQSNASNYGLGGRLTEDAGTLSNKVYTQLGNYQGSPGASVTLQRSWNNIAGTLTLISPNFVSNISLAVAGTYDFSITGGSAGAMYYNWQRINASGGIVGNKLLPRTNYGQVLFSAENVPANTNIVLRLQSWGYVKNTDNSYVNGTLGTSSIVRISATLRAIALV